MRDSGRIQMSLAKSFVFYTVRARRICKRGSGALGLDRLERMRFLKGTEGLVPVRDVNEHGFDVNGSSKPSMHQQEGGILDETAMVTLSEQKILMGNLNLYDAYMPSAECAGACWICQPPSLRHAASTPTTPFYAAVPMPGRPDRWLDLPASEPADMRPPPPLPPSMRLFPCLAVLTGGDMEAAIAWLTAYNAELGFIPGEKTREEVLRVSPRWSLILRL